jgi:hypothetical protein
VLGIGVVALFAALVRMLIELSYREIKVIEHSVYWWRPGAQRMERYDRVRIAMVSAKVAGVEFLDGNKRVLLAGANEDQVKALRSYLCNLNIELA